MFTQIQLPLIDKSTYILLFISDKGVTICVLNYLMFATLSIVLLDFLHFCNSWHVKSYSRNSMFYFNGESVIPCQNSLLIYVFIKYFRSYLDQIK